MLTYDTARTGSVARARKLRRNSTDAERKLWRALRTKLPDFKWRRQMPVGPYFIDFACFAEKLVIEIDGGQHASATDYDRQRSAFLEAHGYRVIRFGNHDVLGNTGGVLEQISLSLGRGKEQPMLRKGEVDRASPQPTSPSRSSAAVPPSPTGEGN